MANGLLFEPTDGQSWPEVPQDAVAVVERHIEGGSRKLWIVTQAPDGFELHAMTAANADEWVTSPTGESCRSVLSALDSDHHALSLRHNEITEYHLDTQYLDAVSLSEKLMCVGRQPQSVDVWQDLDVEYWESTDAEIEGTFDAYECVSRWAAIDSRRVSCVKFVNGDKVELIPAIFDEYCSVAEAEVDELSFSEGDMDRPMSYSFSVKLMKLRPGYAVSLHQEESSVYAGSSHTMRLPLDAEAESSAISAWGSDMADKHMVTWEDGEWVSIYDENGELRGESNGEGDEDES